MRLRSIIIISVMLITCCYGYGQTVGKLSSRTDSIQILQSILRKGNFISSQGIGFANLPSRQWYSFAFLLSLSTNEELLQLTYDSSACLRLMGFIGLTYKSFVGIPEVKKRLTHDTTSLTSFAGCIIEKTTVAKGVNQISNWYSENSVNELLVALQTNREYKSQLFIDILRNRRIKNYSRH